MKSWIGCWLMLVAMACSSDGEILTDGQLEDGVCNPFTQQGCAVGEKCASLKLSDAPSIVQTVCVPDGTQALGDACESGEAGPTTGFDNCQAGTECIFGTCRESCAQAGGTPSGTCSDGAICQIFEGIYDDIGATDVGLCIPGCDPVAGISGPGEADYTAECGSELTCSMNIFSGVGVCAKEFENAPGHLEPCSNGACSLNGCAAGHGPLLPAGTLAEWRDATVFFANTVFGLADRCVQYCDMSEVDAASGSYQGDCPAGNECRYVTGMFLDWDESSFVPDSFGLCMPVADFGSCADHKLGDVGAYLTPEGGDVLPVGQDNAFIPGCSAGAEIIAKVENCTGENPDADCAMP